MAWVDSMRFRRRADKLRALGWINLLVTLIVSGFHISDGADMLAVAFVWAALVMSLSYAAAWRLDKHAERVITR